MGVVLEIPQTIGAAAIARACEGKWPGIGKIHGRKKLTAKVRSNGSLPMLRVRGRRRVSVMMRISANVTADFGNVTDSARSGVARCRL